MPKGRGSNKRRSSDRQRIANLVRRLPPGDPDGIAIDDERSRRMLGDYKPDKHRRTIRHPLQRERGGDR